MVEIDGSFGEGGGQILRTALSLSCLLRKPFRIFNIRKNRRKPGLMPQHLVCVEAAQRISGAEVAGDYKGSGEIVFSPGPVKCGEYFFDIGTAGSTSLVAQTVIPALVLSGERSTVIIKGGTHVPFSPPYHFLCEVFAPFLMRAGLEVRLSLRSYGFYPKGGGEIRAEIYPAKKIFPLRSAGRGGISAVRGCSGTGNLPLSIAERQREAFHRRIRSLGDLSCPVEVDLIEAPTPGQGTFIFVRAEAEHSLAGFSAIGERGRRAEDVGEAAAEEFVRYYETGAALDPHMADQIVLYLALCEGESVFTASCITEHLLTNVWVIGLFHPFRYLLEGEKGKSGRVAINPSTMPGIPQGPGA